MDIVVMDRTKARAESFRKRAPATAIISIADVIMENNGFHRSDWLKSVLYLHFNDVQAGMPFCITTKDAKAIRDFVVAVSPKVERLIVHCVAGISRSAGVAAAIDQALTGMESPILADRRYFPNLSCFRLVCEAFEQGGLT